MTHTVQDDSDLLSMAFIQDVVHESGLAGTKITYMTLAWFELRELELHTCDYGDGDSGQAHVIDISREILCVIWLVGGNQHRRSIVVKVHIGIHDWLYLSSKTKQWME